MLKFLLLLVVFLGLHDRSLAAQADYQVKVIDSAGNPVNNIAVFLTSTLKQPNYQARNTIIKQTEGAFSPYVNVVQKGKPVTFINEDEITHHIYSVAGKNRFSFKLHANKSLSKNEFSTTEEVAMGCNIHDWMTGYVLVVDTPIYGTTNSDGSIDFRNLRDGDYQVQIWHPKLKAIDKGIIQDVKVKQGEVFEYTLKSVLDPIPKQDGLSDFEFLDEY